MDYVLPIGYYGDVHLSSSEFISSTRYMLSTLEECDIILVGAQSQSLPPHLYNLSNLPRFSHELILGCLPDAFLLVVNYDDSPDYISRTIVYLESVSGGKVIALVISPITQNDRWSVLGNSVSYASDRHISDAKSKMSEQFDVPVFSLRDEINLVCDSVIQFFSENQL